jgi:TfoX/Sxy family transcriptional regulator of competence genes
VGNNGYEQKKNVLLSQKNYMGTTQDFADYILDQIDYKGIITYRKMFGEYAVYADGKVVALIADNKLYVKPTEGGRKFIGEVIEAPAYPGAKMSFLIEDQLDDRLWISKLIEITALEVPEPKPKKKSKKH